MLISFFALAIIWIPCIFFIWIQLPAFKMLKANSFSEKIIKFIIILFRIGPFLLIMALTLCGAMGDL